MPGRGEFPSSQRRGGRAINKDAAKPPLKERTGWSDRRYPNEGAKLTTRLRGIRMLRVFFLMRAYSPSRRGEECFRRFYAKVILAALCRQATMEANSECSRGRPRKSTISNTAVVILFSKQQLHNCTRILRMPLSVKSRFSAVAAVYERTRNS